METFEISILGCGSALPTTKHFNSAQVVNIHNKLFMIDCGEGAQIQFRKYKLSFARLNHIFISHLHGDHCFGLIGLISTLSLLGRTADLHIYGPAPLKEIFQPQLDFFCKGMTFSVFIHEINTKEHALIFEDRSVEVWTLPLMHRMPCSGFLFKEKPVLSHIRKDMIDFYHIPHYKIPLIKAGEDYVTEDGTIVANNRLTFPADKPRVYAYCSDTCYRNELAELIKECDLLFHEATFMETHKARANETFHSTAKDAATIALQANVKQLAIGHFSARYPNENVLLEEAQDTFPNTVLVEEGLTIKI